MAKLCSQVCEPQVGFVLQVAGRQENEECVRPSFALHILGETLPIKLYDTV